MNLHSWCQDPWDPLFGNVILGPSDRWRVVSGVNVYRSVIQERVDTTNRCFSRVVGMVFVCRWNWEQVEIFSSDGGWVVVVR